MKLSFFYVWPTWILCVGLFALMIGFIVLGRFTTRHAAAEFAENPGNTAIAASMYGLLGLLLAFTFGMSGDRFKTRKMVIVEEANAIGTAALRWRLYADSVQPLFKEQFTHYLEARIEYFEAAADTARIRRTMIASDTIAARLWQIATSNSRIPSNLVASNQMVPALNAMFDIANSRFWSEYSRTPSSILTMLFVLAVAAAFVVGHTSVHKGIFDWPMAIGFCALTALVIFFIIDLDKPRVGIITLDENARAIAQLRSLLQSLPTGKGH